MKPKVPAPRNRPRRGHGALTLLGRSRGSAELGRIGYRLCLLATVFFALRCAPFRRFFPEPGHDHQDRPSPRVSVAAETAPVTKRFSEDDLKTESDVVGYAKYCKQELGLPATTLAPWNCLEGVEIQITVNGALPQGDQYKALAKHKLGCDHPSWLGEEPCANYAFVQKRQLSDDVDAFLLCRLRSFTSELTRAARRAALEASPSPETFNSYYAFDSLGLILTSKKSGKTCFFDHIGRVYGGYVPSPDDEKKPELQDLPSPKPLKEMEKDTVADAIWRKNARSTWRPPTEVSSRDNCVRCHDSGALKASPWILQAFELPVYSPALPYKVLGKAFASWQERYPLRAISTAPIVRDGKEEPQVCTRCHRMGTQATCELHLAYAIGEKDPGLLSDEGAKFLTRTWMPPLPDDWQDKSSDEQKTAWHDAYGAHVKRLKCCCANPTAKNCLVQSLATDPLPPTQPGPGPEICP